MNVALYLRVSTSQQSTDLQQTELTGYAARMGWQVVEIYQDLGISGTKDRRLALSKLMADARMKRFDAVIVWKLDRMARSLAHLVQTVQSLDSYGVRFISLTENVDTDAKSPVGRLMLHLLGAFGQFERDLIVERVNAGVQEAKRQGKHCGRPVKVWRRDTASQMRSNGHSLKEISLALGVPISTLATFFQKGGVQKPDFSR
jgi:DNA invertase Pin-like site-specific DNA recombinase